MNVSKMRETVPKIQIAPTVQGVSAVCAKQATKMMDIIAQVQTNRNYLNII